MLISSESSVGFAHWYTMTTLVEGGDAVSREGMKGLYARGVWRNVRDQSLTKPSVGSSLNGQTDVHT